MGHTESRWVNNPPMAKRYKGDLYYCPFCRENVEHPNTVPMRGAKVGRFKSITGHMNLCPKCGGVVFQASKSRAVIPHIPSTMEIRRKSRG